MMTPSEALETFDVSEAEKVLERVEKETGFDRLSSFKPLLVRITVSPVPKEYKFKVIPAGTFI